LHLGSWWKGAAFAVIQGHVPLLFGLSFLLG
jgi:hypothetical protein